MPKMKTKSSTKRRFSFTASGKIKKGHAYKRHNLNRRAKDMRRSSRGTEIMSDSDAKIVRKFMPYR